MMNKNNQPICIPDEFGNEWWTLNGQLHREDGPAAEWHDGDKAWYLHGQCHRIDGPAIEYYNGTKSWYYHGQHHRLDGPAIEYASGKKIWYYHGKMINCSSQKEFKKILKLKFLW